MRSRDSRWLTAVGLFTWAASGAPYFARHVSLGAVGLAAYVAFMILFLVLVDARLQSTRLAAIALVLQSVAAVIVVSRPHGGAAEPLLVMVACEVPLRFRPAAAPPLVLAQSVAVLLLLPASGEALSFESFVQAATSLAFQAFGAAAATFAYREREARKDLARVNAELVATRHLFAESHRAGERLRIARDLHDVLGHHLTALVINLEVARNATDKEREVAVQRAQVIAKGLLAEVREVVGSMRAGQPLDLERALGTLAAALPELSVHLDVAGHALEDPATAQALVRCAQEVLTNCARHARARNVWIELTHDPAQPGVTFTARDDGRGVASLRPGHGLSGMKERVEALGGVLVVDSAPGRGTTVRVDVPGARAGG
jgi:signal transduction histidine kinase